MAFDGLGLIDRQPLFYFDSTVSGQLNANQTLFAKMGLAATPVIPIHGQRRVVGNVFTSQAPAAGFPRLRFCSNGSGSTFDLVVTLPQDTGQANYSYPFDLPIFLPYVSVELTNGAGGAADCRASVWVFPEGTSSTIVGASSSAKPSVISPLAGYQQISVSSGGVATLVVPVGSKYAQIIVENFDVRYRDDGSNPTATVGYLLPVGQQFFYAGNLNTLAFIGTNAGNSLVNVLYYN